MTKLKSFLVAAVALAAIALFPQQAISQAAQAVQAQSPLTRDLGALQSLSGQTAATVNSADQSGFNVSRIICFFRQSTYTNSPSTTWKIQAKDATSGLYYDYVTSSAITTSVVLVPLAVGAGVTQTANVSSGLPVARTWRTSVIVAGTTPIVTATVACSVQ